MWKSYRCARWDCAQNGSLFVDFPNFRAHSVVAHGFEPLDQYIGRSIGWYPVFSGQRIESLATLATPVVADCIPVSQFTKNSDLAKQIQEYRHLEQNVVQARSAIANRTKQIQDFQEWKYNTVQAQLAIGDQANLGLASPQPPTSLSLPPPEMSNSIRKGSTHPQAQTQAFLTQESSRHREIIHDLQPLHSNSGAPASRSQQKGGRVPDPCFWICKHPKCTSPAYASPTEFDLISHLRNVHDVEDVSFSKYLPSLYGANGRHLATNCYGLKGLQPIQAWELQSGIYDQDRKEEPL